MAIASYEWMAAIVLVFVAILFLPKFLRSGIFTIPEYLEYRYNPTARAIMAFYTMVIYVGVTIAAVIYSGGLILQTTMKQIHSDCILNDGTFIPNLEYYYCSSCHAKFYGDAAMEIIELARQDK